MSTTEKPFTLFISTLLFAACAGDSNSPPARAPSVSSSSPTVAALDRLGQSPVDAGTGEDVNACMERIDRQMGCRPQRRRRTFLIRLVLDERYTTTYPQWQRRIERTMGCVNRLYDASQIRWQIEGAMLWDPGADRHNLYALLDRLQREYRTDQQGLLLGMTVWNEQRVFSQAAGEIGLSQGAACVVPSWPRIENDCLILAHELGHLTGATHVPGKNWVMSWATSPFRLPVGDAIGRVVATFRFHPRNVAAINAHSTATFTPAGLRAKPECHRRLAAIDDCWSL